MHESERHRIILSEVGQKSVVSISELKSLIGASEATIRRDIVSLDKKKLLTRVRGGAEPINPPSITPLLGKPYDFNFSVNIEKKKAIAKVASEMCKDGDSIIINGGTTTFQMMHSLQTQNLNILTNSWTIADFLHTNTKNVVTLPGGTLYRDQNIILSPFHDGISSHFLASIMFIGAQGVSPKGLLESDPLILNGEQNLIKQAEKLVVLVDSSKFKVRTKLILCPLTQVDVVITDDGIDKTSLEMLEKAGIETIVTKSLR